jgi:hypothetical protein
VDNSRDNSCVHAAGPRFLTRPLHCTNFDQHIIQELSYTSAALCSRAGTCTLISPSTISALLGGAIPSPLTTIAVPSRVVALLVPSPLLAVMVTTVRSLPGSILRNLRQGLTDGSVLMVSDDPRGLGHIDGAAARGADRHAPDVAAPGFALALVLELVAGLDQARGGAGHGQMAAQGDQAVRPAVGDNLAGALLGLVEGHHGLVEQIGRWFVAAGKVAAGADALPVVRARNIGGIE